MQLRKPALILVPRTSYRVVHITVLKLEQHSQSAALFAQATLIEFAVRPG